MVRNSKPRLLAIKSESAEEFTEQFNKTYDDLIGKKHLTHEIKMEDGVFMAVFIYEETEEQIDRVSDLFHNEGIRYVCKQCPHMVDPHRGNQKWCECPYSKLGQTHKEHECCELFYKELIQGKIKPLPDYIR